MPVATRINLRLGHASENKTRAYCFLVAGISFACGWGTRQKIRRAQTVIGSRVGARLTF